MAQLIFRLGFAYAVLLFAGGCGSSPSNDDDGDSDGTSGAIQGLVDNTWTFVPIAGAQCRDGSSTGIALNPSSTSTDVMIYLQGGGACFNAITCAQNASSYNAADFDTNALGSILRRDDAQNPFKDWNFVFVPYCTGDVHSGNAPDAELDDILAGTPKQQFVGYSNMGSYLAILAPTFADTTHVALIGESAGGFGAVANYEQTAHAFEGASVDLIDDSGPLMAAPYAAACLQSQWTSLWNWSSTVIADCGSDCSNDSPLSSLMTHLGRSYPQQRFGLISSTADAVIATFFGFGENDCSFFSVLSPERYMAGLMDIRAQMAFDANFGAFYFDGLDHTSLSTALDTRTSDGVKLSDWVAGIRDGRVSNVGP
ncbi:MAG: hypothetical protein H7Z43_02535 [Clostridia bacterium]|nr:hypothetical protein [Deltaproteobacteria bacterium]